MTLATARPLPSRMVTSEAQLRALIGEPAELTRAKIGHRLNAMTRLLIERSHLWDPTRFSDPATMPTGGQVHRAIQGEPFDADPYDEERADRCRRVGFH